MDKHLKKIYKISTNDEEKKEVLNKLIIHYFNNDDYHNLEYYCNLHFNLSKNISIIIILIKYLISKKEYFKAMHYYNIAKNFNGDYQLNLELINFYHHLNENKVNILEIILYYCNIPNISFFQFIFDSISNYIQPISKYSELYHYNFPKIGDKNASSPSIAYTKDGLIMNVRYKNYFITEGGAYLSNEIKDNNYIVRTSNYFCFLDENYKIKSDMIMMPDLLSDLEYNENRIKGLEDLRLHSHNDKLYYSSTSMHYSPNYNIVFGEYNYETGEFLNNFVFPSPYNLHCEKNWIPFVDFDNNLKVIYNWNPLKIGRVEDKKLIIEKEVNTPYYFHRFRGSSNVVKFNDEYYLLTHSVKYVNPRIYYHNIIVLNKNLDVVRYTHPFVFCKVSVEYCLSLDININSNQPEFAFIFSQFDDDPTLLKCGFNCFNFVNV